MVGAVEVPANDTVPPAGTFAKDQLLPFAQLPEVPCVQTPVPTDSKAVALNSVPVDGEAEYGATLSMSLLAGS